ncbi:sigma 54-interacting transcriptional regulator [Candidatus Clostridium stratigraminis]|uniref:Sigma 54-interacting transcriptional regulator n=1 Tax=Candidatus Clostridium stratigraminis TaxID=3381661 RepID=A0ABW8T6E6_9CLOT
MNINVENKIVIFAIYEKLANRAREAVQSIGIDIEIVPVTLENYLIKAEDYKIMGKEIIITRGMIADDIRANVDINVVNIDIKLEDILNLLNDSNFIKKKIALAITEDKISDSIINIGKLLGLNICKFSNNIILYKKEKEFIDILQKNKIDIILGLSPGDNSSQDYKIMGIDYKVIDSGKEAIIESVHRAVELYEMTMRERSDKEKFKTIINHSSEGILAIDENGVISTFNYICEKYFNINEIEVIGKNINDIFPELELFEVMNNKKVKDRIITIKGMDVICDFIPIKVEGSARGAVASIKRINEIRKAEQEIRLHTAETNFYAKNTFSDLIGKSKEMKEIIRLAKVYSEVSSTILITGESGTGKEILAQAIHNNSERKKYPFVPINCTALPPNLLESELFGYSEGAFTGARKGGKQGLFELAHNGTIFLDEIGEMDLSLQVKLLRVIQEKQILRIGDNKMIPVNVRIISATNKNLYDEVKKGNFRLDLYYRLNVLELNLCPLRERKEDLTGLINEMLNQLNNELSSEVIGIDNEIFQIFINHDWPGNIRELRNILERLVVLTRKGMVKFDNVKSALSKFKLTNGKSKVDNNNELEEAERNSILKAYEKEGFNKQRTAAKLGISRNTLKRKLVKYNIE